MTYRCASCGRLLRKYTVTVTTASGMRGYGPVCGLAIAPPAKPKQAAPVIRNYLSRDNVIQDGQLVLEFA